MTLLGMTSPSPAVPTEPPGPRGNHGKSRDGSRPGAGSPFNSCANVPLTEYPVTMTPFLWGVDFDGLNLGMSQNLKPQEGTQMV